MPKDGTGTSPALSELALTLKRLGRSFTVVRDRLAANEVSSGLGWQGLIAKLESKDKKDDDVKAAFAQIYPELLLLGARVVRLFEVPGFDWNALADVARAFGKGGGVFGQRWPALPSDSALAGIPAGDIELVAVEAVGDDLAMIFGSRRMLWLREEIQRDKISGELDGRLTQALGDFDRLVKVRHENLAALDVAIIRPKDQRMDVFLDHPRALLDPEATSEAIARILSAIEGIHPEITQLITGEVNLYPSIKSLYTDLPPTRGKVHRLKHLTSGGSSKQEAMHVGEDLRDETFHRAGAQKVGVENINPYAIAVELLIDERAVKLSISGKLHGPLELEPQVTDIHLDNFTSHAQAKKALGYLLTFRS